MRRSNAVACNKRARIQSAHEKTESECYRHDGEHHLSDVKGVPPIMVSHVAVVLLDAQQPSTENFVIDVKSLDQIQI